MKDRTRLSQIASSKLWPRCIHVVPVEGYHSRGTLNYMEFVEPTVSKECKSTVIPDSREAMNASSVAHAEHRKPRRVTSKGKNGEKALTELQG